MKTKIRKLYSTVLTTLILSLCLALIANGQSGSTTNKSKDRKFEITIIDFNLLLPLDKLYIITNNELKIVCNSKITKKKDSILFTINIQPSDTLQMISEINLNNLKNHYVNGCIDDGSQITVIMKKNNEVKSIFLENYYQEEIGKIISFFNSLAPAKYKIWYDREKLISDYKLCKQNN